MVNKKEKMKKIYLVALSVRRYDSHAEYFRNEGFEVITTTSLNDLKNSTMSEGSIVLLEPVMGKPVYDLPGLTLKDMPMLNHSSDIHRNRVGWGIYYWLVYLKEMKGIKTFFLVSEAERVLMGRFSYHKQMSFLTAPGTEPKEMLNQIAGAASTV
jgi:hypothetical protein